MKIAVFLGHDGRTISFSEVGVVKVYSKDNGEWNVTKEIPFNISEVANLNVIHEKVRTMAQALEDCRIFAAVEVKGIPYTILEGLKFNIWKVEGTPESFLDYILEKEKQEKLSQLESEDIEVPVPMEKEKPGYYYINLKEIMENSQKITSKQVLIPFFQNMGFSELEIDCSHIPPWFEKELPRLNLESKSKFVEGGIKVRVYPKK